MKMKRLILFAAMLICFSVSAQTFNAVFNFANYVTQPTAVSLFSLTPQQPDYNYTNATLVPTPIYTVTGNSGQCTVSNLVAGYSYQLDLKVSGVDYLFTNNFPVGLSGTVSAQPYNGFWSGQIFCYYTPPGVAFTTNSTVTYFTNYYNVTNNLSGTNFYVGVSGNGGATVATNGNVFTVSVPLQTGLTNPLGSAAYLPSGAFISTSSLPSLTNLFLTASATNNLVQNSTFTAGTNTIATNDLANLISTNALLVASLNTSVAALNASIATSSNLLQSTKQNGSVTLSNLAVTGAFTNGLVAGTNTVLTTNVLNQVAFNAPLQTQLTNGYGSIVTHAATDYILTNALPSLTNGFVTSAITNGLVGASVTNGLATTNYVNAQGFVTATVTNGLATTNFVLSTLTTSNANFATYASLIASNTASLTITTNMVIAATNALASTSYVATAIAPLASTASLNSASNVLFTAIVNTNAATQSALSNQIVSATNSPIFVLTNNARYLAALTNANQFVAVSNGVATNLTLQGVLVMGTKTNLLLSTNIIWLTSSGSLPAGTWLNTGSIWTNVFATNLTITTSAGNYYALSNAVTEYASTDAKTWTLVSGSAPAPTGGFGHFEYQNGVIHAGWNYDTNLTWQITNAIATVSYPLNFLQNSNLNYAMIQAYAVAPTNGITATTGTNIANSIYSNNAAGYLLPIATNGFVTASVTNGLASISFVTNLPTVLTNGNTGNGQIPYSTNNGVGYFWGSAPSGGGSGIATLNGNGTNTTLITASYIGVTNFYVVSNSWLASSNMLITYSFVSNSIPHMTASNAPYGNAFASTFGYIGTYPYFAFQSPNLTQWYDGASDTTNCYIGYQFPLATMVSAWSGYIIFGDGTLPAPVTMYLQGSTNGVNWSNVYTTNFPAGTSYFQGIQTFSAATNSYYRWYFNTNGIVAAALQLYGASIPENVISNTPALYISAASGVSINTTISSTNALNVVGNVNTTVGYTVNGVPIFATVTNIASFLIAAYSNAVPQMVFTGTNTPVGNKSAARGAIYNQFDAVATNTFLYQWINTNGATGWQ